MAIPTSTPNSTRHTVTLDLHDFETTAGRGIGHVLAAQLDDWDNDINGIADQITDVIAGAIARSTLPAGTPANTPGGRTVAFTSNPVFAACGLRMMARHFLDTIDHNGAAHPDRLRETAEWVNDLLADAANLSGPHQDDPELRRRAAALLEAADQREATPAPTSR